MNGFSKNYIISRYATIRKGRIACTDGIFDFPNEDDGAKFLKGIYKDLKIDYPKFYKMDRLCKLAFIKIKTYLKSTSLKK